MTGRSVWALLNAYYAVLRETKFRPTQIIILSEAEHATQIPVVKKGLAILSEAYGIAPAVEVEQVQTGDFMEAGKTISARIKTAKSQGCKVAIDITPGRKALVAGALIPVASLAVDHVFYLQITTTDDAAKPYMMIPLASQQLRDFSVQAPKVKT
jgi:CRISPR/Cas system-associated protein Csm6